MLLDPATRQIIAYLLIAVMLAAALAGLAIHRRRKHKRADRRSNRHIRL